MMLSPYQALPYLIGNINILLLFFRRSAKRTGGPNLILTSMLTLIPRDCVEIIKVCPQEKISSNNIYSGYSALNNECLKQGQIQGYKEKLWQHRIEFILLNWISNLPSSLFHCLWLSFKIRLAPRFPCDNRPFAFAGSLRKR